MRIQTWARSRCEKLINNTASTRHRDPQKLLEETFATYMLALRSRRGNVVGKILRSRAFAGELAVNELYNVLCTRHLQ